eukprot:gnl/TRDRNA2_/TRDRNA2_145125_c2_seq1.p2 gnl/TRDRNA2_/TRDRNA2_145125_c2~~gnl/TRDRNA2_/TRDRNA2_145125_c2_seq1.p2  ORF type:complete len:112 (+),score=7.06 gnl/TRDRNA2_/TRDRNA2_145125_c2_seq1:366-701(+)
MCQRRPARWRPGLTTIWTAGTDRHQAYLYEEGVELCKGGTAEGRMAVKANAVAHGSDLAPFSLGGDQPDDTETFALVKETFAKERRTRPVLLSDANSNLERFGIETAVNAK